MDRATPAETVPRYDPTMSEPLPRSLDVEAFLEWAMSRSERYELVEGTPIAMAPERAAHARKKGAVYRALVEAIGAKGLDCEAFTDGMTVKIDDATAYEPDAVVHCGPPIAGDALLVTHPVIVVEVLSPSSRGRDAGAKLADYFRLPTVAHYLLVHAERPTVIHHARRERGEISTRILSEGVIALEPPGIELDLDRLGA